MARLRWEHDGLDWPHRAHSRLVMAGGLRWHVQVAGQGPVLLLLHGTGASSHSMAGLLPLLTGRHTVVVPDLPGHAFTDALPGAPGLPAMSRALAALLAVLDVAPPALVVGHSAGAAIGAQWVLDGQAPVRALVSINGALRPFDGVAGLLFAPLARLVGAGPLLPGLVSRLVARQAHEPRAMRRLIDGTGSQVPPASAALYARLAQNPAHVAGALAMMSHWDLRPLAEALPRLPSPLWLLASDGDRMVPPAQARELARRLPQARHVALPGTGHLAHEEQPAQVAALIARAWDGHDQCRSSLLGLAPKG